jgi:putative sigma-54 modulation protein
VLVHDRTQGLPGRLIDYAERRLHRLSRHFDRVLEVEVEFANESRRGPNPDCTVGITVRTDGHRHPVAHAHETGPDARGALDLAMDKIDRQVVKLKEKIKIERKRAAVPAGYAPETEESERRGELERVRLKLRPESLADAEAALEGGRHPCYVFLDEGTGQVNVCFRRPDGGLTVIEPVVI